MQQKWRLTFPHSNVQPNTPSVHFIATYIAMQKVQDFSARKNV